METPYTLLSLPQPLDSINGQIWSAPSYTLHGSRKRKRDELVVGIDGESVNIYQINNQALHAAYALPPRTYICCNPTSYFTRAIDSTSAQRDTFVVLKDGLTHKKSRLVRFQEKVAGAAEFAVPVKSEYALPEGSIRSIHALASQSLSDNRAPQILVTYSNGETLCVAEDMSRTLWRQSVSPEEGTVAQVWLEDVTAAQKGMLKNREDLVALLQPASSNPAILACFLIHTPTDTKLRLYAIHSGASRNGLQSLDDVSLPPTALRESLAWSMSASFGQLLQLNNGQIHVYDLTGIAPRLQLTIREKGKSFTSCSSISRSLLVATTNQRALLYDLNYGSLQASADMPSSSLIVRKRKRHDDNPRPYRMSLHWFSEHQTVIAASGGLIGIQLKPDTLHKPHGTIRLASVVGKSIDNQTSSETAMVVDDQRQTEITTTIDKYIDAGDVAGFETSVAQDFGLSFATQLTNPADSDVDDTLWNLDGKSTDLGANQIARALTLMQKLFVYSEESLHLQLPCRNVLRWLFNVDMLTSANLSSVHGHNISTQNIVQALVAADPGFLLVQDILTLSVHLPLEFAVEALALVIRSLGDDYIDDDGTSIEEEDQMDIETKTAEAELQNAILTLQAGLEIRSITVRLLFGRIHAFPKAHVVKALSQGLQLKEQVFFIHLLRMELASAGWTRPYVEINEKNDQQQTPANEAALDEDSSPSDRAIKTIGNLMLAAVDAIGPAGWLVGLTTGNNDDALLDVLRAEVAATMEGVIEATNVQAYLDDFERYVSSMPDQPAVYSRQVIEVHSTEDDTISMPLGGRSQVVAQEPVNRKGGKIASNFKAREKDAKVGLYQFERIRI